MSGAGVNAVKSAAKAVHGLTLRQKIWDAMSAWTLRNAGFQQLGKGTGYVLYGSQVVC